MYDAGHAFISIVPSFRGVQTLIGKEAKKWGRDAGREFDEGFDREVGRSATQIGPGKTASRKQGSDAGGSFADGFKRKVEAAMRSLPPVKIGPVQSGTVDAKLRDLRLELERLSRNTIGVDVDSGTAMAELGRIDRELAELDRDGADIQVRVDAGAARAQLAAIHAQVNDLDRDDVHIRVDADNASLNTFTGRLLLLGAAGAALAPAIVPAAGAAAGALAAIGPAALVGLGGIAALAIGFQGIGDAVGAMGAAQESAAEDAQRAAGQQASAAQAVASARRQLEQAERGLANTRANVAEQTEEAARRVVEAQEAVADAEAEAAAAAEDAQRRIADARRAVVDASEAAADQVADALGRQEDAEDALADAQRRVRDAQLDLTRARQDARDALEDLTFSTRSAALAEEDAELGLARARERLAETMAEGVGGLDLAEAQLAVQQAELRLDQARDRNQDVQAEARAAEEAGVEGAESVLAAQRRLDEARESRVEMAERAAEAERAVADARVEGAERVAEAEQALADVVAAQQARQEEAAERIIDAQERVTDAVRAQEQQQRQAAFSVAGAVASVEGAQAALAAASVSTGVTGSAAMRKLEDSMAALSPAGREFATFLYGLKPLWDDIVARAQTGLLPGVQAGLEALMPVMPAIVDGIGVFADVMGDLFAATGEALASPAWQAFFERMVDAAPLLLTMGEAFGTLALGLGNLFIGFAPLAERMFGALIGVADALVAWTESAGFQEFLDRFIGYVLEAGPQLLDFFGSLLDAIVNLVRSMLPFAPVVLEIVGTLLDLIASLPPGVLAGIVLGILGLVVAFNVLAPIIGFLGTLIGGLMAGAGLLGSVMAALTIGPIALIVGAIGLLVGALVAAYMHSETFRNIVNTAFRAVGDAAKWLWNEAIKPAFDAIAGAVLWAWRDVIQPALEALVRFVRDTLAPAAMWLWRDVIQPAFDGIAGAVQWAWDKVIRPVFDAHTRFMRDVLGPAVRWLWNEVIQPAWTGIQIAVDVAWSLIKVVLGAFEIFIRTVLAPVFGWLWREVIQPTWNDISSAIQWAWENVIRPVFAALGGFIENHVAPAFQRGVDAIGRIWDTIKDMAKAPVRFVVETVINDGIIESFNTIARKVPGVDTIDRIVLPEGFATGGIYPGYTPGRDIGMIRVSGGEAIMRPEWTRAVGPDRIHAMNAAARSGGTAGVRALLGGSPAGGPLGAAASLVGDQVSDIANIVIGGLRTAAQAALSPILSLMDRYDGGLFGDLALGPPRAVIDGILGFLGAKDDEAPKLTGSGYQALTSLFRATGLDGVVTSTLRPGDPGYHGRGKAADFSVAGHGNRGYANSGLRAIFEAFLPIAGDLSELILAGAPFNIKNGRQVGGYAWGNPGSPGNHWNHVHAALFDQGGRLPTGLTTVMNATGSPELVLNGQQESLIESVLRGRLTAADVIAGGDGLPDMDYWAEAGRVHGKASAEAQARRLQTLSRVMP